MNLLHNLSDTLKGNILMLAGIILLLNTLGVTVKFIYVLTLVGAVCMIVYGFVQAGYYHMIMNLLHRPDHRV